MDDNYIYWQNGAVNDGNKERSMQLKTVPREQAAPFCKHCGHMLYSRFSRAVSVSMHGHCHKHWPWLSKILQKYIIMSSSLFILVFFIFYWFFFKILFFYFVTILAVCYRRTLLSLFFYLHILFWFCYILKLLPPCVLLRRARYIDCCFVLSFTRSLLLTAMCQERWLSFLFVI